MPPQRRTYYANGADKDKEHRGGTDVLPEFSSVGRGDRTCSQEYWSRKNEDIVRRAGRGQQMNTTKPFFAHDELATTVTCPLDYTKQKIFMKKPHDDCVPGWGSL